jgi:hypothetical protein
MASRSSAFPPVDERLAPPETRYEVWHGELVYVSPAHAPHGKLHSKVLALLEAHVRAEFDVACDMLTRTSQDSDIAPDVSVFPAGADPETGGRQLEELVFEIVGSSTLTRTGKHAAELMRRGVRRVFAIEIKRARLLEWSKRSRRWIELDSRGRIHDPALEKSPPIAKLIRAGKVDDTVARALIAKGNPVIERVRARDRAKGEQQGFARGLRELILDVLQARGVRLRPAERKRILGEQDLEQLQRWRRRVATCKTGRALFD